MATLIDLVPGLSYKTREACINAVNRKYPQCRQYAGLKYIIMTSEEGRFFPVFLGESANRAQVFLDFHVIG